MDIKRNKPRVKGANLERPKGNVIVKKSAFLPKKESRLMNILKENLSCEMYHAL